jgi:DNA repair ATPase RecN
LIWEVDKLPALGDVSNTGEDEMDDSIVSYRQKIYQALVQRDSCVRILKEKTNVLFEKTKERDGCEEAQGFLQKVAQDTQSQLKIYIEDLVQLALDTIFPGKYEFKLEFEIKRGKTEARLVFLDDGEAVDPMDASGGGLVNMAALGLRIAVWALGKTRPIIGLDEPGHFLSSDLQAQFSMVLKELSETLGVQFLIVTHKEEIVSVADRIFAVKQVREGKYRRSVVEVIDAETAKEFVKEEKKAGGER